MRYRILFDFLLFGSIFCIPWWGVLALAVFGVFYFSVYYEIIIAGVIFDALYGTTGRALLGYGALGLMATFALFVFLVRAKHELR